MIKNNSSALSVRVQCSRGTDIVSSHCLWAHVGVLFFDIALCTYFTICLLSLGWCSRLLLKYLSSVSDALVCFNYANYCNTFSYLSHKWFSLSNSLKTLLQLFFLPLHWFNKSKHVDNHHCIIQSSCQFLKLWELFVISDTLRGYSCHQLSVWNLMPHRAWTQSISGVLNISHAFEL